MSEKRFTTDYSDFIKKDKTFIKRDNERLTYKEIVDLLNEQQSAIIELQERIIDLKDDKNQLHKVISKLRQEVAELKTRNAV